GVALAGTPGGDGRGASTAGRHRPCPARHPGARRPTPPPPRRAREPPRDRHAQHIRRAAAPPSLRLRHPGRLAASRRGSRKPLLQRLRRARNPPPLCRPHPLRTPHPPPLISLSPSCLRVFVSSCPQKAQESSNRPANQTTCERVLAWSGCDRASG